MSLDLRSSLRMAGPPLVAGKAITLGVGWLTVWATSPVAGLPSWAAVSHALSTWDGESYRAIAENGYPGGPLDPRVHATGYLWAFFPGLPIAVHVVHFLVVDTVAAAVLVNAACELVALAFITRLVELERRDSTSAETAAWALALYPYAAFLTVFYTEAPFLAAASASLYYLRRGEGGDHARACVLGMLASTTRITGLALLLPIALERARRRRRVLDPQAPLALLVAAPVGAFMLYAWARAGDALAWFHIEASASFGSRNLDWPWNGLSATWASATSLPADRYGFVFSLEVVFGLLGLALLAVQCAATVWRLPRVAPSLALFSAGVVLPPLFLTYWLSVPRYLMSMVPMYLLAADVLRGRDRLRMPALAISGALMAFGTFLLASGRFLA